MSKKRRWGAGRACFWGLMSLFLFLFPLHRFSRRYKADYMTPAAYLLLRLGEWLSLAGAKRPSHTNHP